MNTDHRQLSILASAGLLSILLTVNLFATYPEGYYKLLDGKCGLELMHAVKAVVRDHNVISYGNDTWDAFRTTDVKTVDGRSYWWDMYSNELVPVGSSKPESTVMNIEHSVANSWWGGTKNDAYKDIVHLNPSNANANSRKSNYPLCELATVTWDNGVTFVGKPTSGQGGGSSYGYEPADEYKGDFARVFMYMFTVYDDIAWASGKDWMYDRNSDLMFRPWAQELLLRWSATDAVSEKELSRNDGIWQEQKNRNPFIDLPDLADHIWGSKATVPYSLNGTDPGEDPGKDPGEDPGKDPGSEDGETLTYTWLANDASDMGEWTIENVTMPEAATYIWNWRDYNGNHYLNASAFISNKPYASKAYAWSPEVALDGAKSATLSFKHAAKFQTTLRNLCCVVVRQAATNTIEKIAIPQWPQAGTWTFVPSGDIDLSDYAGKKVNIGLLYESDSSGADTWEINDMTLTVTKEKNENASIGEPDDNSMLVEVWGNNILAPEGARIFDMNGREVRPHGLQPGIYVVVSQQFKTAVKAMVR